MMRALAKLPDEPLDRGRLMRSIVARRNRHRNAWIRDFPHRISNSASFPLGERLFAQLFEQCLGILQVGSVEALGEPVVDFGEHRARLVTIALRRAQTREAHRRAQF